MSHEAKPLSADEHLKFKAIVDRLTYNDPRRALSSALARVTLPQPLTVQEAWHRVARRMWRTN
jgi:hypothetical protein